MRKHIEFLLTFIVIGLLMVGPLALLCLYLRLPWYAFLAV